MTFDKKEELIEQIIELYLYLKQIGEQTIGNYPLTEGALNRDNLLAYLALRERIPAQLEQQLVENGLASLLQSNAHILYSLHRILENLGVEGLPSIELSTIPPAYSKDILHSRVKALLGKRGNSSIIVTLDVSMIHKPDILEDLLMNGMSIARINCAHEHEATWEQMIVALRNVEKRLMQEEKVAERCKIFMDLAGPKIRIGKLQGKGIFVKKGDLLRLYLEQEQVGHPATGEFPAGVPVSNRKAFRNVRVGDSIFIDDGKIHGKVQQITSEYIQIEILLPVRRPQRIKEQKGLNLPDSYMSLNVPALTDKDTRDLSFVTRHADIVGLSFVHSPLDLKKLRDELKRHDAANLAVVAKIETKDAVHHLARIILEGLNFEMFGVMIARGDLAIEVGAENLSYVQEDIVAICRAAYIPVIWATGVLERLTKKGSPSRSEITDAVQGLRADCIMLNKGPFIVESVKLLNKLIKAGHPGGISRRTATRNRLTNQYGIF
ncbi:pyruvate kinase [Neobacillus dielmonensis]|uniref:pyruvate kinase n=1 Tax=Neobacillus dielmonensis TaxID=1347369 RepID=UPI0005A7E550|nr:pyruvate kinase [Neobacillus dielmonensis]